MPTVRTVSGFNKRLVAAKNKVVVLDFYARNSKPCQDIDQLVQTLEYKYASQAIIIKVNVDKFDELVDEYRVRSMPTFVFLKSNHNVAKIVGADEHKLAHLMAEMCESE
ncbi:thioredoxin-1-like [Drosophila novamexicana]|uniref:thioredoxin-1-like n=1 Tax=Drosophila novamexicana TaxID=47314 RepID=UPI0011E5BBFC|nr:thioredoxin-1-like [Drosophila novamexicana]